METGGWGESEGQVHNLPEALYRGEERLGWLEGRGQESRLVYMKRERGRGRHSMVRSVVILYS